VRIGWTAGEANREQASRHATDLDRADIRQWEQPVEIHAVPGFIWLHQLVTAAIPDAT